MKPFLIALLASLSPFALADSPEVILPAAILCADQADNRIRLVNPHAGEDDNAILWSYPETEEPPIKYRPTDAKRVEFDDEVCILAAYHGRVRLIRFRDSKLIRDYSTYSSCHSAELLPDGLIVSVNSNHGILRLHHSVDEFVDLGLPYAHGVTWDKERNCLWVLGDLLYQFHYLEGKLTRDRTFELPLSPTGHDLFPLRNKSKLLVSNNEALFLFDLEAETFETVSELGAIKSASQHADGSIWVSEPKKIEGAKSWHSDSLISVFPEGSILRHTVDGSRFYKARWWQEVDFSY